MSTSSDGSVLPTLVLTTHFWAFLAWFHSLDTAIFGRYPTVLVLLTSWVLQCSTSFTSIASQRSFLGSLWQYFPVTCLASEVLLKQGGRSHDPLLCVLHGSKVSTVWMTLPSSTTNLRHICCILICFPFPGAENWKLHRVGSCPEGILPFIPKQI